MTGRHTVPTAQMPSTSPRTVPTDGPSVTPADHTPSQMNPAAKKEGASVGPLLNGLFMGLLAVMVAALLVFQLTHRPTYEYMTTSPSDYTFEGRMNELGAQGWKSESCRRATSSGGYSASYECIMSRPKLGW